MPKDNPLDDVDVVVHRPDDGSYKGAANDKVRKWLGERINKQDEDERRMERILNVAEKAANATENVTRMAGDTVQAFKTLLKNQERLLLNGRKAQTQLDSKSAEDDEDEGDGSETKGS